MTKNELEIENDQKWSFLTDAKNSNFYNVQKI